MTLNPIAGLGQWDRKQWMKGKEMMLNRVEEIFQWHGRCEFTREMVKAFEDGKG
jgi:hypothetical protein